LIENLTFSWNLKRTTFKHISRGIHDIENQEVPCSIWMCYNDINVPASSFSTSIYMILHKQ